MQDTLNTVHKLRALTIYWSSTGNTEKVAKTIHNTLECQNITATIVKIEEAKEVELYEYDLIFLGAPSYMWLPPDPVRSFIKGKMRLHDGLRASEHYWHLQHRTSVSGQMEGPY